jgi:TDG/mug DNA glycosylase family protein
METERRRPTSSISPQPSVRRDLGAEDWRALPAALAGIHASTRPRDRIEVTIASGASLDEAGEAFLIAGGGFAPCAVRRRAGRRALTLLRMRTLADLVRPGLRLLICGLNPSLFSADAGIPFARPGNRFWAAMRAAGLVERERDPHQAFARGIGFTDLVKRATPAAAEIRPAEYRAGLARLEWITRAFAPRAVCFVGLDGWRRAVDPKAQPGWTASGLGGRPAYLMPSTSGRNARCPPSELAAHLARAASGPSPRR